VIDPRALQQHFQKVHQKERPSKPEVPRVPDPVPLTAVQAISIPTSPIEHSFIPPIQTQESLPAIKEEAKIEPPKELINLVIDVPPPIDRIIINDVEEVIETEEDSNLDQTTEVSKTIEEYDPYGYYSGPKF